MDLRAPIGMALVPAAFLVVSLTSGAITQAPPPVYVISYMKAAPGRTQDYQRLEQEIWKPMHQERIRAGQMTSCAPCTR